MKLKIKKELPQYKNKVIITTEIDKLFKKVTIDTKKTVINNLHFFTELRSIENKSNALAKLIKSNKFDKSLFSKYLFEKDKIYENKNTGILTSIFEYLFERNKKNNKLYNTFGYTLTLIKIEYYDINGKIYIIQ
jgi:predicted transposase YbfD/YdcC